MGMGKIIEAELELPEEIIQHIQYFLNGKEAAQTTLLSKSWYAAWLTRPNLDFDQAVFRRISRYDNFQCSETRFWEYMKKTVETHETLNLKIHSLRLWVYEESVDIIWDIIPSCPLIENLSLSTYNNYKVTTTLSPFTEFGKRSVGSVFDKLKSLLLNSINDVDTLFFNDFSSIFPCLKDLSLHDCGGYKELQVFSPSLECISVIQDKKKIILRAKFDVPSICKFTYSGPIPSLSFKTTSTNWRSHISIKRPEFPDGLGILMMNKLLIELSQSKVSLFLDVDFRKRFDCSKRFDCPEGIKGLHKPEVENLMINPHQYENSELFDALFLFCRPIYVTLDSFKFFWINYNFKEFVYKRVMLQVGLKCKRASQSQSTSDLENVDMEFYDEAVCAWRPRLVDASTRPGANKQRLRLHLKWRN